MKTTFVLVMVTLSGLLFSTACQGGGSFTGPHCVEGTCVRLDAAPQAGGVGTLVPVTVIVESQVDVPELHITLDTLPGEAEIVGESQWTVHVLPSQPVTRISAIRPKGEGYVHARGLITWGKGPRYTQYEIRFQVTKGGITPNPTTLPSNVITLPSGATRVLPVPPPLEASPDLSKPGPMIAATPGAGTPSSIPTPPIPPGATMVLASPLPPGAKPTSPPTKVPTGGSAVPTAATPRFITPTPKPYP